MLRIIAGEMGGRKILAPSGHKTRPTQNKTREALFSILQHKIPGCRFLDLFAGSGANGLEAVSRGAASVVFVERDGDALRTLRGNIRALGAENRCELAAGDFKMVMGRLKGRFDVVFMDPPYNGELIPQTMERLCLGRLVDGESAVVLEHEGPLPDIQGFTLVDQRKYGRTLLSFFQWKESADEDLCVPGEL
ncbi:MAG: 16S rRNA (guanine(966)-N(2))-methyltransferase RsmD [Christensenellales bacterium]|jgi:16S rRNA (guanine966-N2)-methyltransferase